MARSLIASEGLIGQRSDEVHKQLGRHDKTDYYVNPVRTLCWYLDDVDPEKLWLVTELDENGVVVKASILQGD